jgi:hypothetical protein
MSYTPTTSPGYLNSDWGSSKQKEAALHVNHVADKAKFAIDILESALASFDTIEKEIVDVSNSTTQPTREQIKAFAYRIDMSQKQVADGLKRIKDMMSEFEKITSTVTSQKTTW